MKKLILLMIVLVTVSVVSAQTPSDFPYQHIIENVDFENLSISGQIDVFISQADVNTVEIRYLEPDRMEYVTVDQKGRTLSIRTNDTVSGVFIFSIQITGKGKRFKSRIQVHVGLADIKQLSFANNCRVTFLDDIQIGTLTTQVGSRAQVNANDLNIDDFTLNLNSYGTTRLGNIVSDAANITIGSYGKLNVADISSNSLDMNLSSYAGANFRDLTITDAKITIGSYANLDLKSISAETLKIELRSYGKAKIGVVNAKKMNLSIGSYSTFTITGR